MNVKIVILVVVAGLVITLFTGLVSNTPAMLMGATHYGFPVAWLFRLVIAPEYFPWRVDIAHLLIDTATWAAVATILVFTAKTIFH